MLRCCRFNLFLGPHERVEPERTRGALLPPRHFCKDHIWNSLAVSWWLWCWKRRRPAAGTTAHTTSFAEINRAQPMIQGVFKGVRYSHSTWATCHTTRHKSFCDVSYDHHAAAARWRRFLRPQGGGDSIQVNDNYKEEKNSFEVKARQGGGAQFRV
jgi:hypothetical protein